MTAVDGSRWDHEVRLLAWLAVCVSVFSFLVYFRHGDVLLYGDAVAHINIARRVFDSKTPGLLQLGTVWLPLPHLVMVPFVISDEMWRRGTGGSIPSLVAYVFGVIGMFRLVRGTLSRNGKITGAARVGAWTAAVIYAANPNLIYMQTTAMGEAIYLAFFIWSVVYFSEYLCGNARALRRCGWCLAAACWTRYDGWFLAVATVIGVVVVIWCRRTQREVEEPVMTRCRERQPAKESLLPRYFFQFVLIVAAAPALWFVYNAAVYRNPLEFANGPYSAKAIEQKTGTVNPSKGNLYAAAMYFLKSAELNVAEQTGLERLWLLLAAAGTLAIFWRLPGARPLLWLWLPLPFYALSVAYGAVPIFVPTWWPFSRYNVRYGLELLPVFAATVGVLVYLALMLLERRGRWRMAAVWAALLLLVASYASIWVRQPICYREAAVNMRGHLALDRQLANWLKALPADATLLMYLGEHVGAVQQAGIPLKRVINEGNHRVWRQPADPEGIWERALAHPAKFADYVVAFDGDRVWQAMQGVHLKELVEIKVTGQPRAVLYCVR
jgi:hypothetical protein